MALDYKIEQALQLILRNMNNASFSHCEGDHVDALGYEEQVRHEVDKVRELVNELANGKAT